MSATTFNTAKTRRRVSFVENTPRKKSSDDFDEQSRTIKSMITFEGDDDLKSFDEEKEDEFEFEDKFEEASVESEDPVDIEPGAPINKKNRFLFNIFSTTKIQNSFRHFPRMSIVISDISKSIQSKKNTLDDKIGYGGDTSFRQPPVPSLKKNPLMKRLLIPLGIILLCLIITLSVVLRPNGPILGNKEQNFTTSSNTPSIFHPSSPPSSSGQPTLITKASFVPSLGTTTEHPTNIPSLPKIIPVIFTQEPTKFISTTNTPKSQPPLSSSPSLQPSIHPTINPNKRYDEIRVLLESMIIEFQLFSIFDDLSSPQYRSLEWIANGDLKALQLPSEMMGNGMLNNEIKSAIIQRWTISLLWFTLNGSEWKTNSKWLDEHHECDWYGIECNSTRITKIVLSSNNLVGMIPSEIGYLKYLEVLKLRRNSIEGSIPSAIEKLQNLEELHLMSNSIGKKIPTQIGQLSKLVSLDLCKNNFIGNIPSEIGGLTNLNHLELWSNKLEGKAPDTFVNLVGLTHLYIDNNFLTGTIPTFFGEMSLEVLSLGDNLFTGSIPPSIYELTDLKSLWLNRNLLEGSLSSNLIHLSKLENLYLEENLLTGTIRDDFLDFEHLVDFRLYSNRLTGCIPSTLFGLQKLELVYIDSNQFGCSIPKNIFSGPSIVDVRISNNQLSGLLPVVDGSASTLEVFMATDNVLTGPIPESFGNIVALESLALSRNMLEGSIPTQLSRLKHLAKIELEDNQFKGAIPNSLSSITGLREIRLEKNLLTGTVPYELCSSNIHYLSSDCNGAKIECSCCNNCPKGRAS